MPDDVNDHGLLQRLDERTKQMEKNLESLILDLKVRYAAKWVERVMIGLILALVTGAAATALTTLLGP